MTILQLENVSLSFSSTTKPVLENIAYEIKPGDFIILLGSNGSGKSSLLKLMHRQYYTSSGHIRFLNKNIYHFDQKTFSRQVNVITQNCSHSLFSSLTVFENYQLLVTEKHTKQNKKAFLQHYLDNFHSTLADRLNTLVEALSGGEKQALILALRLLQPPKLLLLDEHTSAMDPNASQQLMTLTKNKIEQHGITCVLTTHDLNIALRYGNRILILHEGKIRHTIEKNNNTPLSKEILMQFYTHEE